MRKQFDKQLPTGPIFQLRRSTTNISRPDIGHLSHVKTIINEGVSAVTIAQQGESRAGLSSAEFKDGPCT